MKDRSGTAKARGWEGVSSRPRVFPSFKENGRKMAGRKMGARLASAGAVFCQPAFSVGRVPVRVSEAAEVNLESRKAGTELFSCLHEFQIEKCFPCIGKIKRRFSKGWKTAASPANATRRGWQTRGYRRVSHCSVSAARECWMRRRISRARVKARRASSSSWVAKKASPQTWAASASPQA